MLAIELDKPGHKHGQQAPTLPTSHSRRIADFDISPFSDATVAVSSEGGQVGPYSLQCAVAGVPHVQANQQMTVSSFQWDTLKQTSSASLSGQTSSSSMLHYHPLANQILLEVSPSCASIWDISTQTCTKTLDAPQKGWWSACWSSDGQRIATATKAATVQLYDARHAAATQPSQVFMVTLTCRAPWSKRVMFRKLLDIRG